MEGREYKKRLPNRKKITVHTAGVLYYRGAKKYALLARKLPERSTKDLPKPAAKK
jgi:hypothetical protein